MAESIQRQFRSTNWWQVLKDGLRGRGASPTEGPIVAAILTLAVPMVLEMAMESLFAIVNIFWVGHLGAAATASIGLTESLLSIIYTVAAGLSMGVMAVVARRSGEGDPDGASDAAFQTIVLGAAISIVLGVIGGLNAKHLLVLMGADDSIVRTGGAFATIMLSSNGVILMLFLLNAAFRGSADAAIAMRVLWLANVINLVLDPCLIFGLGPFPAMGVTGTAVATTIGRGVAVMTQLAVLFGGRAKLKIAARHVRVHVDVMWRVIKLSGMGTLQVLVNTSSWIALVRVLSTFGSDALAGYTIGIRIIIFALLPAWGLANAAATMVGQNLGAKQPDRANQAVWIAGTMNLVFLGSLGVVFILAAPFITGLFGGDAVTTSYAIRCLRIVSAGFFFYAFGMVITNSFNGAGDTRTPMLLNLCCFWLWEIPIAYVLSTRFSLGPTGVFMAIMIAFSTLAIVSALVWRRGRWRAVRV